MIFCNIVLVWYHQMLSRLCSIVLSLLDMAITLVFWEAEFYRERCHPLTTF